MYNILYTLKNNDNNKGIFNLFILLLFYNSVEMFKLKTRQTKKLELVNYYTFYIIFEKMICRYFVPNNLYL